MSEKAVITSYQQFTKNLKPLYKKNSTAYLAELSGVISRYKTAIPTAANESIRDLLMIDFKQELAGFLIFSDPTNVDFTDQALAEVCKACDKVRDKILSLLELDPEDEKGEE